jgi:hypothetical protein
MLFFITLGNCAICKFEVPNVLSNLNGNIIGFNIFSMFFTNVNRRRYSLHFWKEPKQPRQYTHWDLVETNVWHTSNKK